MYTFAFELSRQCTGMQEEKAQEKERNRALDLEGELVQLRMHTTLATQVIDHACHVAGTAELLIAAECN